MEVPLDHPVMKDGNYYY